MLRGVKGADMNFNAFVFRVMLALALVVMVMDARAASLTYRLHVDGLSCPFCTYGIEKKLGGIEGVVSLDTSIKDGTVTVVMKDGVSLSETTARQAVKAAGFSLRKFEPMPSPVTPEPSAEP